MFKIKTEGKKKVRLLGLNHIMILALMVVKDVYDNYGTDLVITSATDGKHSRGSLHYSGYAVDIRTRDFTEYMGTVVRDKIAQNLGHDFDVVLEKTHIHIEFQPKEAE